MVILISPHINDLDILTLESDLDNISFKIFSEKNNANYFFLLKDEAVDNVYCIFETKHKEVDNKNCPKKFYNNSFGENMTYPTSNGSPYMLAWYVFEVDEDRMDIIKDIMDFFSSDLPSAKIKFIYNKK